MIGVPHVPGKGGHDSENHTVVIPMGQGAKKDEHTALGER
jgi:hypothetical protein